MEITYLSKAKKRINAALVISMMLTFGILVVIFFLLLLDSAENSISNILLYLTLSGFFSALALSLISLFVKPKKTLERGLIYELEVNTDESLTEITKPNQIRYSGSFLKNEDMGLVIEVDNQVTFRLMNGELHQTIKTIAIERKTTFLESSPKVLIGEILESMGSFSP